MPVEELINQSHWKPDHVIEHVSVSLHQHKYKLKHPIKRVAVIGAGPAGLPTAKLLKEEGLDVVIYERSPAAGGTWIYNPEPPLGPTFPSTIPSQSVQPSLPPSNTSLPFEKIEDYNQQAHDSLLRHAPPTPCYQSLRNNVATPLIKYKDLDWPNEMPWFTTHDKILDYLQAYSKKFDLDALTEFDTSLEKLTELPDQCGWKVLTKKSVLTTVHGHKRQVVKTSWKEEVFDSVVLATGHYHAPFVPDIPGLVEWKKRYPEAIIHSKQYRTPKEYEGKTILLIGDGTSALDISRDVGDVAKIIYQSVRESNHGFDEKYRAFREEVKTWLPPNVKRVPSINNIIFNHHANDCIFEFLDGTTVTDVDVIIVCTGYLFNYHFLQELHDDPYANSKNNKRPTEDRVLVKQDGSQLFNLHKDIFYIPNPTLSFIGVPFHIATFSFFEFQAYAVARVYSQSAFLPSTERMRQEWTDRLKQKGAGREFHALGADLEQAYIKDIVDWLNTDGSGLGKPLLEGHSQQWFDVKEKAFDALRLEFKQRLQLDPN
ncbi:putative FAD dependent oxidoreductase [Halteromyces radiatus]|uniref:putative FAD dependent oxidoreductase n=1 Tax=Halteromyces radiatus TaxID=101107 RepID=UPI002220E897|nr:putative FAD dependent oxidoreductase [Halteromyces radiatus]KAI8086753.1 putative FAD dependent oxidoreductase [Halteromyces radiatus]